jgi:hypothetical protein
MIIIIILANIFAQDLSQLIDDGYIVLETEDEQVFEDIVQYYSDNPVIWESAKSSDIKNLPINDFMKQSLILFWKDNKRINNWGEFQQFSGFSSDEIASFKFFIILRNIEKPKIKLYEYHAARFEDAPSLTKTSLKFKYTTPSNWHFSGIAERDENEPSVFDHTKLSIHSPEFSGKTQFLFGSFRMNWGTGLLFASNPMKMLSNSGSSNLYKTNQKFYTYSGSDENNFLFGIANKTKIKGITIFSFYSNHYIDCRIEDNLITSLPNTGYHVTELEQKYKNKLNSRTVGISATYHVKNINFGILNYHQQYELPIEYLNSQSTLNGTSLIHNYNSKTLDINGEFAVSNDKFTFTESIHYQLGNINFGMSYRYLQPEFRSIYGSIIRSFGGHLDNEKGFYYYFGAKLKNRIKFSIFSDFSNRIKPAIKGEEIQTLNTFGIYFRKSFQNSTRFEFKWNHKSNDYNPKNTFNLRILHPINKHVKLYSRYIFSKIPSNQPKCYGQVFSSYIKYNNKITAITLGNSYYFSNSNECRNYIYEPGIPMKFNISGLSGTGENFFLAMEKKLNSNTTFYLSSKIFQKDEKSKYLIQMQLLVAL